MPLPAPLMRGFALLAIATTLTLGHVALAGAAPANRYTPHAPQAASSTLSVLSRTGLAGGALAENCYLESHKERTADGRLVSIVVEECD